MDQILEHGWLDGQESFSNNELPEDNRGDYYMDVREFQNGTVEVMVKTIRPMHEGAIRSACDPLSYSNACKELGESSSVYDKRKHIKDDEEREFDQNANRRRAVRRTKQKVRWMTKEFGADRLLTLSYRGPMTDREKLHADFRRFVRLVRSGWDDQGGIKDWRYVAVPEKHHGGGENEGGFHIHCAVKGWQKINFLRVAWYKALGGTGKESGENTPGQVNVESPESKRWGTIPREWKTSKLAAYLTKYLTKTFDENEAVKKRFWSPNRMPIPVKTRFILDATDLVGAIKEMKEIVFFHYGQALDFSRSWLTGSNDCLWLSLGEAA